MLEMLSAAHERGWEYVGISDHSKAAYYAGGLTEEQLKEQHAEIARHEKSVAADARLPRHRSRHPRRRDDGLRRRRSSRSSTSSSPPCTRNFKMRQGRDDRAHPRARWTTPTSRSSATSPAASCSRAKATASTTTASSTRPAERGVMIEINGNPQPPRRRLALPPTRRRPRRDLQHPPRRALDQRVQRRHHRHLGRAQGRALAEADLQHADVEEVEEFLAKRRRSRHERRAGLWLRAAAGATASVMPRKRRARRAGERVRRALEVRRNYALSSGQRFADDDDHQRALAVRLARCAR